MRRATSVNREPHVRQLPVVYPAQRCRSFSASINLRAHHSNLYVLCLIASVDHGRGLQLGRDVTETMLATLVAHHRCARDDPERANLREQCR